MTTDGEERVPFTKYNFEERRRGGKEKKGGRKRKESDVGESERRSNRRRKNIHRERVSTKIEESYQEIASPAYENIEQKMDQLHERKITLQVQ